MCFRGVAQPLTRSSFGSWLIPCLKRDRQAKAETPSPPKAGVEAPAVPAAPAPKSEKKDGVESSSLKPSGMNFRGLSWIIYAQ